MINARFVLTLRCNYNCFFCHAEGVDSATDELSMDEIGIVAEALRSIGVDMIKLTGGEPTVRDDIVEIVSIISNYGKPKDLSMTTNGYLLEYLAGKLREAGLHRLNVSLHSLKSNTYEKITGINALDRVIRGIKEALNYDFKMIKLNVVVIKEMNEHEIWDIIDFAGKHGLHVQLIELHPVGKGRKEFDKYHTVLDDVVLKLREISAKIRIRGELHNRPIYYLSNGVSIEVVRPVMNPIFCAACSRIRITPDGYVKPCLTSESKVPIKDVLKANLSRQDKVGKIIERLILANTIRKPSTLWPINPEVELEYVWLRQHSNRKMQYRINFIPSKHRCAGEPRE